MHLFDRALQIDLKNLLALLGRADIAITRGDFTTADEILDPILRATPDNFMANYLRATELIKRQQYAAADETLGHVSTKLPLFPAGYYLQGMTKLALGQLAQAEEALHGYLNNVSDDRRAVWLIAIAALQQHSARRAIEYLKLPLDKLPADATTLTLLGTAYMADRKPEVALRQFEAAAALDPENPQIKTNVAISKIDSGQTEQGLAQLEQLFAGEAGASAAGPTLVLSELRAKRAEKGHCWARPALRSKIMPGRKPRFVPRRLTIQGLRRPLTIWRNFIWQRGAPTTPKRSSPIFCRKSQTTCQTPLQEKRVTLPPFSGWQISRSQKRSGPRPWTTSTVRAPSPNMIPHPG